MCQRAYVSFRFLAMAHILKVKCAHEYAENAVDTASASGMCTFYTLLYKSSREVSVDERSKCAAEPGQPHPYSKGITILYAQNSDLFLRLIYL